MLPYIVFYMMFAVLTVTANVHIFIISVFDIMMYTSLACLITLWITGKYRPRFKPLHNSFKSALGSGFILGAIFALLLTLKYFLMSFDPDTEASPFRLLYLLFKRHFLDSMVISSFTNTAFIFLYGWMSMQGRPKPKKH